MGAVERTDRCAQRNDFASTRSRRPRIGMWVPYMLPCACVRLNWGLWMTCRCALQWPQLSQEVAGQRCFAMRRLSNPEQNTRRPAQYRGGSYPRENDFDGHECDWPNPVSPRRAV